MVRAAVRPVRSFRPRAIRDPLIYNDTMALTQQEVEHIARLARLELTTAQQALYREQLSAILDYIARLRELDTTDVPPTAGGGLSEAPLRPDESRPSLPTSTLLANAPDTEDDQFKIPPVF